MWLAWRRWGERDVCALVRPEAKRQVDGRAFEIEHLIKANMDNTRAISCECMKVDVDGLILVG